MNSYTARLIHNVAVIAAIVSISLGGFIIAQSGSGCWSILLALFMAYGKKETTK